MSLQHRLNLAVTPLRRMTTSIIVSVASLATAATPTSAAKDVSNQAIVCKARGTAARLEMRCPTATVAELLDALRKATGLQSEYVPELATTRVSVPSWRGPLLELLESALSAFNFVIWTNEGAPSGIAVSIVGTRGAIDTKQHPGYLEHPPDATEEPQPQERAMPPTEPAPTLVAPPNGEARTAATPEKPASSDTPASTLEPPPATGTLLQPPTAGATPLEPTPVETRPTVGPGFNTQP